MPKPTWRLLSTPSQDRDLADQTMKCLFYPVGSLCLLRYAVVIVLALALVWPVAPAHAADGVVGDGTPASCTEQELTEELAGSATISFNCGDAPITITLTSQKLITRSTTIDGGDKVTISGGGTTGIFKTANGTGWRATIVSLTLLNLTLRDGKTAGQGGAIELGSWNYLTVRNSHFLNNEATRDSAACDGGGAIFVGGDSLALIDSSTFRDNRANNGGAINSLRSRLTVLNSTFQDNQAIHTNRINGSGDCGGGGAIYMDGARITPPAEPNQHWLRGNHFSGNTTNNHGGALFIGLYTGEAALIEQSEFVDNQVMRSTSMPSSGTGGAIWYGPAASDAVNIELRLHESTLTSNRAEGQGGGLWTSARTTLRNVTFHANDATDPASYPPEQEWRKGNGGALAVANSAPVAITNATFANNHAGFNGGAIAGKTVTLRNTMFANNTTDWSLKIMQHCTDPLTDAGGNLQFPNRNPNPNYFNETNCTTALKVADPQLGGLADHGGSVRTLALPAGSPAQDLGVSAGCPFTDARGVSRPQGAACDSGAFERINAVNLWPTLAQVGRSVTLTVSGVGFTATSQVLVEGQPQPTTFVSGTTVWAEVPATLLSTPGTRMVSVSGSDIPSAPLLVVEQVRQVFLSSVRK